MALPSRPSTAGSPRIGADGLSNLELFRAGRDLGGASTALVPFWSESPRPPQRPRSAGRPTPRPPPSAPPSAVAATAEHIPSYLQQTTSASPRFRPPPPRLKPPSSSYRTEAQRQLQKTAQPFRLTARQRADALLAINDFHINVFLERRRCLPAYRTISKAKKAAIEGCFGLLDKDGDGSSRVSETHLLLRSLGLPDSVVAEVVATAKTDDSSNVSRAEFTRLCVEADKLRRAIEDDDEQQDGSLTADAAAAAAAAADAASDAAAALTSSSAAAAAILASSSAAAAVPPLAFRSPRSRRHRPPPPKPRWVGTGGAGASSGIGPMGSIRGSMRFFDNGGSAIDNGGGVGPLPPGREEVPYFESPRASSEAMPLKLLMECNRIHGIVDAYVATLADRPPPVSQQQSRRPARTTARGGSDDEPRRPALKPGTARPIERRPSSARGGATKSGVPLDIARRLQILDD